MSALRKLRNTKVSVETNPDAAASSEAERLSTQLVSPDRR